MALVTVTATKIDFQTVSSLKRGIPAQNVENLRPTTEGNLATAAIFDLNKGNGVRETWYVSETYADLLVDLNNALAEQGAELASNKATTFATINDTLYPSTEAVFENFRPIWYVATPLPQADTYSANLSPAPTAYAAGMTIFFSVATTNTTAATFNANSLGAKAITKGTAGTTALVAGDLVVGKVYTLVYDGTRFQINL